MISKIEVQQGDITRYATDAIVNAANTSLLGGGGVDGAIHRCAGKELLECTRKLGGCKTGMAKLTPGFKLPAKYIIHTVGPIWRGGEHNEDELLRSCYTESIRVASGHNLKSIAFPAISTGAYGFPLERATEIAINAIRDALKDHPDIEKVILVCFDQITFEAYNRFLTV